MRLQNLRRLPENFQVGFHHLVVCNRVARLKGQKDFFSFHSKVCDNFKLKLGFIVLLALAPSAMCKKVLKVGQLN
jgi:hypothetical protein